MKKSIIIFLVSLISATSTHLCAETVFFFNQTVQFVDDSISPNPPQRIVTELDNGVEVTYNFNSASKFNNSVYANVIHWRIPDFTPISEAGKPEVSGRTDFIYVPYGHSASANIVNAQYIDLSYDLAPAYPLKFGNDTIPYDAFNYPPVESFSGFFPQNILAVDSICRQGETQLFPIEVYPIQYNQSSARIRIYKSITYRVTFTRDPLILAPGLEPPVTLKSDVLKNLALNNSSFSPAQSIPQPKLIIFTPTNFEKYLNDFIELKRMMGYEVEVFSNTTWSPNAIKTRIRQAYKSNSDNYVLLVGDHSLIQSDRTSEIPNFNNPPEYIITDFPYSCYDDHDLIPDLYCGRIPVSNHHELKIALDKIISYTKNPTTNHSFYNTGLNVANLKANDEEPFWEEGRSVKTSTEVKDYLEQNYNLNINRHYFCFSNASEVCKWNLKYSSSTKMPNELKGSSNPQPPYYMSDIRDTNLCNGINNGALYVLFNGHGSAEGWEMSIDKYVVDALTNGRSNYESFNLYPIVFSSTCLTGKFDEDCFAKHWFTSAYGGAIGVFANSNLSVCGFDEALLAGAIDAIWPSPGFRLNVSSNSGSFRANNAPVYNLGKIWAQACIRFDEGHSVMKNISANMNLARKYSKQAFHCFGDPTTIIHTNIPTEYTNIAIDTLMLQDGSTRISVSLPTGDIGYITLYDKMTNNVQYTYGSSLSIDTNFPEYTSLCVYDHNRIPYIENSVCQSTQEDQPTLDIWAYGRNITIGYTVPDYATAYRVRVFNLTTHQMQESIALGPNNPFTWPGFYYYPQGYYALMLETSHFAPVVKKIRLD